MSFTEFVPTDRDPSWLPHARAVGIESDREYGLAVLRELRREAQRRATALKRHGVTKLADLPRGQSAAAHRDGHRRVPRAARRQRRAGPRVGRPAGGVGPQGPLVRHPPGAGQPEHDRHRGPLRAGRGDLRAVRVAGGAARRWWGARPAQRRRRGPAGRLRRGQHRRRRGRRRHRAALPRRARRRGGPRRVTPRPVAGPPAGLAGPSGLQGVRSRADRGRQPRSPGCAPVVDARWPWSAGPSTCTAPPHCS